MWIFWLFLFPMLWGALWRSSSLCELKWNLRFVPGADLCAPATRECSVCWTKPEVVWIKTFKIQILWTCILFSAPNISLYASLLLCSTAFQCRYSLLDLFFLFDLFVHWWRRNEHSRLLNTLSLSVRIYICFLELSAWDACPFGLQVRMTKSG